MGSAELATVFRRFDVDGSGGISLSELSEALPLLGLKMPRRRVQKMFDESTDGSGA